MVTALMTHVIVLQGGMAHRVANLRAQHASTVSASTTFVNVILDGSVPLATTGPIALWSPTAQVLSMAHVWASTSASVSPASPELLATSLQHAVRLTGALDWGLAPESTLASATPASQEQIALPFLARRYSVAPGMAPVWVSQHVNVNLGGLPLPVASLFVTTAAQTTVFASVQISACARLGLLALLAPTLRCARNVALMHVASTGNACATMGLSYRCVVPTARECLIAVVTACALSPICANVIAGGVARLVLSSAAMEFCKLRRSVTMATPTMVMDAVRPVTSSPTGVAILPQTRVCVNCVEMG
mmetsp:Transcript_28967/g.68318  ORF Transcript_28967/g.68318 Transcript_28967/m.68318 type:complete len:305 (-) Transcript_28967:1037-1951(-)